MFYFNMKKTSFFIAVFLSYLMTSFGSYAQKAPESGASLPGGASALTETYGDWLVQCNLQAVKDEKRTRLCSVSQLQQNQGTRVLAVELQPTTEGATGVMILPFGLSLSKGVAFQVDEAKAGAAQQFSTCLPAGCLVPLNFGDAQLKSLNAGKTLNLLAEASTGNEVKLVVSLDGFSAGLNRAKELLK